MTISLRRRILFERDQKIGRLMRYDYELAFFSEVKLTVLEALLFSVSIASL